MARPHTDPFFDGLSPLLDMDALDVPRRLSRDEGRRAVGPDWSWTPHAPDEDSDND